VIRIGQGFDAHALGGDGPLVLGGVVIPDAPGLRGHSDADVLAHAIADALLGAAGLGDIGRHFPANDRWRDASSMDILEETRRLVAAEGWSLVNVDATVVAERPKLAPFIEEMRERVATALGTERATIAVKATTTDGLGFTGRGDGIAALAVALIERS
jgi:2-C-methyl-D-erythritol 2,4-cyclodiphosphate synthase